MLLAMGTGIKTVEMMQMMLNLNAVTFPFIVTPVIARHILDLARPLTVRLQKNLQWILSKQKGELFETS